MPLGPLIDTIATLIGAIIGAVLSSKIPERLRIMLPLTFGAVSMAMGIVMIAKVSLLPPVILALLLGSAAGELLKIESGIGRVAIKVNAQMQKWIPVNKSRKNEDEFLAEFVSALVLFSASGTGIFGAMNEGITHDTSILVSKAFLDFFTALIFATSLGYVVATAVIPQCVILFGLYFLGRLILPMTTPQLVSDFSACGGVIMLVTGFRICKIKMFPVANMLPALLIVMTISHYWRILF